MARYYLRAIENHRNKKENPELLVNANPNEVNLEHILPKKPIKEDWPLFSEDNFNENIKKIGDLTLLDSIINTEIGNLSYSEKREHYGKSRLWITKMINESYEDWSPDNINDRQEKLSELAIDTWNLKFD